MQPTIGSIELAFDSTFNTTKLGAFGTVLDATIGSTFRTAFESA
jgi:hypothetical protein